MAQPARAKIVFDEPDNPAAQPATKPSPTAEASPKKPRQASREGRRGVQVWLSEAAFKQLRRLAADQDMKTQDCVLEGIDMFFAKHGRHRIARD